MQWNGLVEMETFMSGAFKKKKKWYSNKERQRLTKEERPRDSHIRIKVMSKSRIMNTQEKKRSQDTRGRRYVHVSNLFNSGELSVTITEIH